MEYKKKTIIWEDNNEPPKNYIWAKKDGKFYEYDYNIRDWVESTSINSSGSGSSGDVESFINAVSNLSIIIKKEKSGFFSETGEPINNTSYADPYYYSDSIEYKTLGTPTPLEEYFDISDINAFKAICGLVKNCDKIDFVHQAADSKVQIELDAQNLLGEYSTQGYIIIDRSSSWINNDSARDEYIRLAHMEYGNSSTYYPTIYLHLDPSDPTKFFAKPEENAPEK